MFELQVVENLEYLANRAQRDAAILDAETGEPTQISALHVLRGRAKRYRDAQAEIMYDVLNPKPYPIGTVILEHEAKTRMIRWVAGVSLSAIGLTWAALAVIH